MADETRYPTRIAPYGLRLDPDLKARIQRSAEANGRSLHAELVEALGSMYPEPKSESFSIREIAALLENPSSREVFEYAQELVLNTISGRGHLYIGLEENHPLGGRDIIVQRDPPTSDD